MKLPALFRRPTPLEQAAFKLAQARRDQLTAAAWAEHYQALTGMYQGRIRRLEAAVQTLSTNKEQQ